MDFYLYLIAFAGTLAFVAYPVFASLKQAQIEDFDKRFLAFRVHWIKKYYPELSNIQAYTVARELPIDLLYEQIGLSHLDS